MFETVDAWMQVVREPIMNAANQVESLPVLFAFLLGAVGALAPCQLSGNISAITLYGSNSLNKKAAWREVFFFITGKITAFSGLGLLVLLLGREFQRQLPIFFEPFRQLLGPMLIFIGLYLLGLFSLKFFVPFWKKRRPEKKGAWGAFLLGFSFSLGFCPTMFLLFFVLLMPAAVNAGTGVIVPPVFAVGTSLPLLFVIFVIWYLELGGSVVKKSRKAGEIVQKAAGIILIAAGLADILIFW